MTQISYSGAVIDFYGDLFVLGPTPEGIKYPPKIFAIGNDGTQLWSLDYTTLNYDVNSSLALSNDGSQVYFIGLNFTDPDFHHETIDLLACSVKDGSILWVYSNVFPLWYYWPTEFYYLTVNKKTGSIYTKMGAVNGDGSLKWGIPDEFGMFSTKVCVSPDGSLVYESPVPYFVSAINESDGSIAYQSQGDLSYIENQGGNMVVASDGTLYFYISASDGSQEKIYALNPDLTTKWIYDANSKDEKLFIFATDNNSNLVCSGTKSGSYEIVNLNGADGSINWTSNATENEQFDGNLSIDLNGVIYMGEADTSNFPTLVDPKILALTSGGIRSLTVPNLYPNSEISIGSGHIYFINYSDGLLYSLS